MEGEEFICARNGCEEVATKKTHNQKYHNDECCRLATNERIMARYYARRDQKAGKVRHCSACGVTKLSRYNDYEICNACQERKETEANKSLSQMLLNISWQA